VGQAKRRDRLAAVLFDLSKYLLTAVAAAALFTKEVITWPTVVVAFLLALGLIGIAWFLTPAD
jgi:hypothetical protein